MRLEEHLEIFTAGKMSFVFVDLFGSTGVENQIIPNGVVACFTCTLNTTCGEPWVPRYLIYVLLHSSIVLSVDVRRAWDGMLC